MPAAWDIVSWLTAIGLVAAVIVPMLRREGDLGLYLLAVVSGVLVPIWTIWLGASLRPNPEPDARRPGPRSPSTRATRR